MPLPVTFATLPAGNESLALLDTQFAAVAGLGVIPCTASGTNTILLTPFSGAPAVTSYPDLTPSFIFVAPATSTGPVTINVAGVGSRAAYKSNGLNTVGAQDIVINGIYRATPLAALAGGAGGFNVDCLGESHSNVDLNFFIDGGGSVITTGDKAWMHIPFPIFLNAWRLMADQVGSITVDILRAPSGPPTTSIVGSGNIPTLASQIENQVGTSGWTSTLLNPDDWIAWNVTSASAVTKVMVTLSGNKG